MVEIKANMRENERRGGERGRGRGDYTMIDLVY